VPDQRIAMLPLTPTKLGRYEIVDEIGKGAMGVVYLARDPLIGRLVALKTFRIGYSVRDAELEQFRARFIREAQSAGILSHPNIVTIHDVVERSDEGLAFIAMEYVRGTNLKAVLQEENRPTLPYVTDIIAQVAEALDYAHSCKVIHRDIKPANILITSDQRVKITDFGIARIDTSNLTQEGQLLGTPNYMAPEQILGRDIDSRADIFSLGVVLYEMLTRHKPFQGENLTVVSHRIVYDHFTPPRDYIGDLPPGVEPILARALEKDPNRRYQRARELAESLRRVLAEVSPRDVLNETQSLSSTAVLPATRIASVRSPVAATGSVTPYGTGRFVPQPNSPDATPPPDAAAMTPPPPAPAPGASDPVAPPAGPVAAPAPAGRPSFLRRLLPRIEAAPSAVAAAPAVALVTPLPVAPAAPAADAPPPVAPVAPPPAPPVAVATAGPAASDLPPPPPPAPASAAADTGHRFAHSTQPAMALPTAEGTPRQPRRGPFSTTPARAVLFAALALVVAMVGVAGLRYWMRTLQSPAAGASSPSDASRPALIGILQEARRLLDSGDARGAAAAYREAQQLDPHRASVARHVASAEKLADDRDRQMGAERTIAEKLDAARASLAARRYDEAEKGAREVLQMSADNSGAQEILTAVDAARQRVRDRTAVNANGKLTAPEPVTPAATNPVLPAPQKGGSDAPPAVEAAKDATLQLAFFSQLPEGSIMVYLNGARVLLESFRFYEKGSFFRPKPGTGWVRRTLTVPAGNCELRVYVTPQGHAAEVRSLSGNFIGGSSRHLDVQLNESGQVSATLH
jgi:serine/threonine protein kinase